MRNRRKRVKRQNGSVYRIKGKRKRWKGRRQGVNRRIEGSQDWTKQRVWASKTSETSERKAKKEKVTNRGN